MLHSARLVASSLLVTFAASCSQDPTSQSVSMVGGEMRVAAHAGPVATAEAMVHSLRQGKISTFLRLVADDAKIAEMKSEWHELRRTPMEPGEDAQFQQFMGMLLADDAEDMIYGMVKPQLAQAQQQLQGLAAMLPMLAAGALEESGAPAESAEMIQHLGQRIVKFDLTDESKARKAIRAVIATAEALDVTTGADLQALDFDALMGKVDIVYGGLTDVLEVYGLELEETLASIRFEEVAVEGDSATLNMSFELFGMERESVPFEMERVGGRWMPTADTPAAESDVAR